MDFLVFLLCLEFVKEDTEFGPVASVSFNIEQSPISFLFVFLDITVWQPAVLVPFYSPRPQNSVRYWFKLAFSIGLQMKVSDRILATKWDVWVWPLASQTNKQAYSKQLVCREPHSIDVYVFPHSYSVINMFGKEAMEKGACPPIVSQWQIHDACFVTKLLYYMANFAVLP